MQKSYQASTERVFPFPQSQELPDLHVSWEWKEYGIIFKGWKRLDGKDYRRPQVLHSEIIAV